MPHVRCLSFIFILVELKKATCLAFSLVLSSSEAVYHQESRSNQQDGHYCNQKWLITALLNTQDIHKSSPFLLSQSASVNCEMTILAQLATNCSLVGASSLCFWTNVSPRQYWNNMYSIFNRGNQTGYSILHTDIQLAAHTLNIASVFYHQSIHPSQHFMLPRKPWELLPPGIPQGDVAPSEHCSHSKKQPSPYQPCFAQAWRWPHPRQAVSAYLQLRIKRVFYSTSLCPGSQAAHRRSSWAALHGVSRASFAYGHCYGWAASARGWRWQISAQLALRPRASQLYLLGCAEVCVLLENDSAFVFDSTVTLH